MPTLRDCFKATVYEVLREGGVTKLPSEDDRTFQAVLAGLVDEFIENYESLGSPYGTAESDMVRYFMSQKVKIVVSEEDIELH